MPISPRSEKLDLRLTPHAKQSIVVVAEMQGWTMSDFVLTSALERADKVLATNEFAGFRLNGGARADRAR